MKVMPISDNQLEYAKSVVEKLQAEGIRVELDGRQEKIGYKIREAQLQKIPYMLILGEKEVGAKTVGVRSRKDGDIGAMEIEKFAQKVKKEVENYEK